MGLWNRKCLVGFVLLGTLGIGLLTHRILWRRGLQQESEAARVALARRHFRLAQDLVDRCVSAAPGDADIRLLAARIARHLGAIDEAQTHLSHFTDLGGDREQSKLEYLLLELQAGEVRDCEPLLDRCARRPHAPETGLILDALIEGRLKVLEHYQNLGMTFLEGEPARERARVTRAIELWKRLNLTEAQSIQALVWEARNQLLLYQRDQAAEALRKAVELDPDHYDARYYLAATLSEAAPTESAVQLEALRTRHPQDIQVGLRLAFLRRGLGQLSGARELVDEVLRAEPQQVFALIERARISLAEEEPAEAERYARRALEASPDEPTAVYLLSRSLHALDRVEEARVEQQRYARLESARLQKRKEETERAKEAFMRQSAPPGPGASDPRVPEGQPR